MTYGFNQYNEHEDWRKHHKWHFYMCTVFLFGFGFLLLFLRPDRTHKDWARREAFLELARREKTGLPLISKDLLPADRVAAQLPSDEQLADFEIII